MKKIVLSIKPLYSEKIFSGEKTFEYRRILPKEKIGLIVVYSTFPTMKVIGEVKVKKIITLPIEELWTETNKSGGITYEEFLKYFTGKTHGHAYILGGIKKYKRTRSLKEFNISFPPQSFIYL